jgi:hypothetical protein
VPDGAVMRLWHVRPPTTFVPVGADQRGLLDALRVEWDERGVRFAARPFASRPQVVWQVGGRWHFLGRVAREESTSFLGDTTTVASVTSGVLGLGTGRVVAVRDGRAEGAEMPAGWILDAAFGDDLRGLALRMGGEVWRTDDGGARWSPVDLSGDVGIEVYARDGERRVRGAAGCFEVGPVDVRTVPCDGLAALPAISASERAFLLAALPPWRVLGPADDEGAVWLTLRASDAAMPTTVRDDPASDHLDLEHPMELPCARPSTFVSGKVFLRCDERHGTALYLLNAGGAWRPHLQARRCSAQPTCVASGDGERLACEGACVDDGACDGGSLCERVGTAPAVTVRLPEGTLRWRIVGYANGRRVLSDRRTSLARAQLWREGEPPSPLARDVSAVVSIDGPFALGSDGAVHLATRDGSGTPMVMDGRPGEPFVARTPPPWRGRDRRQRRLVRCGDDGVFLAKDESATWFSRWPGDDWRALSGVSGMSVLGPMECASWGWRNAEGTHVGVGWGAPQGSSHSTPSATESVREPDAAPWTFSGALGLTHFAATT